MQVSRSGQPIITPPQLPDYLSAVHDLKTIVGKPTNEDVKAIHAVIRAMNAVAHLPTFYDPDLSTRLSQHLFGAQMAVYQSNYSISLFPGSRSIYTPPSLPSHIPCSLKEVVGAPSNEEIHSVQSALRTLDVMVVNPQLFDADLSAKLSQHLFNIQFARYMRDSAQGRFAPDVVPEAPCSVPPQTQELQNASLFDSEAPNPTVGDEEKSVTSIRIHRLERASETQTELNQLGDTMKEMNETMKESKNVLENMNRMLALIKRDQSTVIGCSGYYYYVLKDPLNQHGIAASECGLPPLRYAHNDYGYCITLTCDQIAQYLKFLDIGVDLLQDIEVPKLIEGKQGAAESLLLKQMGIGENIPPRSST